MSQRSLWSLCRWTSGVLDHPTILRYVCKRHVPPEAGLTRLPTIPQAVLRSGNAMTSVMFSQTSSHKFSKALRHRHLLFDCQTTMCHDFISPRHELTLVSKSGALGRVPTLRSSSETTGLVTQRSFMVVSTLGQHMFRRCGSGCINDACWDHCNTR